MASPSKEENVLKLILENSPLKEWHFNEIFKKANVSKSVANKWLKEYTKKGLIKKINKKGKFPFFKVGRKNPTYYSQKKLYMLKKLHQSGLITGLLSTKNTKTIIIFGSTIKGDWYKNSDIDIFVLGNLPNFNKKTYENKLQRNIELHIFQNKKEIKEIKSGLVKNIINGYIVKGKIQDIIKLNENQY